MPDEQYDEYGDPIPQDEAQTATAVAAPIQTAGTAPAMAPAGQSLPEVYANAKAEYAKADAAGDTRTRESIGIFLRNLAQTWQQQLATPPAPAKFSVHAAGGGGLYKVDSVTGKTDVLIPPPVKPAPRENLGTEEIPAVEATPAFPAVPASGSLWWKKPAQPAIAAVPASNKKRVPIRAAGAGTQTGTSSTPAPKTQAEYNAIPKGAQFIDTDGKTKTKK